MLEAKDEGHRTQPQVLSEKNKKKVFKNFFHAISNFIKVVARIVDWERPKPQIAGNDVIKNLPVGT